MSDAPRAGVLVALEGVGGSALGPAAARLAARLSRRARGVSRWDASGIFTELAAAEPGVPGPSPRTLTILYAADLAFRLRWQIGPALAAGRTVVAAPYVDTAIAFGRASGLPHAWLAKLFAFAPAPAVCYRLRERSSRVRRRRQASYVEFCCATLDAQPGSWDVAAIGQRTRAFLDRLERAGRCRRWRP